MRGQPASKSRNAKQFRPRRIASAVLYASLMAGIAWAEPTMAIAQTPSSDMQLPAGMHMTSPFAARSAQPAGIPLGSTEIATPGISPVVPSQGSLLENCTGTGGAPFDGGGMSEATSLSYADISSISSPLPSPSAIGPVRIPLGATEIGGAGISPPVSVAGPAPASGMGSVSSMPATINPGNP